jgi:hypothetical protein
LKNNEIQASKITEQLLKRKPRHCALAFGVGGAGFLGAKTQRGLATGHKSSTFKPTLQRLEDAAPGY